MRHSPYIGVGEGLPLIQIPIFRRKGPSLGSANLRCKRLTASSAYYQDWQSEESSDTENTTESQSPRPHDSQQQVDSDQRPTLHKRVMPWLHKTYNYFRSGWQQLLHRKGRDSTNKVNPSEARKPEETGSAWIGSWGYESSRSAEVVAGSDGSQGTALASSDALGEGEASYLLDDSCDEGFILSEMDLPFDDTRFRSPL